MSANDVQHGGTHYKKHKIQVWDFILANGIPYMEGSAIKYLCRWREKGGLQDLNKAIHFIQRLIEEEQSKQEIKKSEAIQVDLRDVLVRSVYDYGNPSRFGD